MSEQEFTIVLGNTPPIKVNAPSLTIAMELMAQQKFGMKWAEAQQLLGITGKDVQAISRTIGHHT